MKIIVDLDKLKNLVEGAENILITPDAEVSILKLYEMRDKIDKAIEEAKIRIEGEALKLNPNFKSVHSDNLSIAYRAYGQRYAIEEQYLNMIPKDLYKKVVRYSPEPKNIDQYIEANEGKVPLGIAEKLREKKIVITVKKGLV